MKQETQRALIVAAMIAIALWLPRYNRKEKVVKNDYPDGMVIVGPVGSAASVLIDEWAASVGVELRRYDEGVDLSNAEPWVRSLYEAAQSERPAAAINRNGVTKVVPVTETFLEELKAM